MTRLWRAALVTISVCTAATIGSACGGDGEPVADIELDGSPRHPDVEGLVRKASFEEISIDDETYDVSKKLMAFSTYTLAAVPVVDTRGAYVHAGVKDGTVVWLAVVGRPVTTDAGRAVLYTGSVRSVEGTRVRFVDGTILKLGPGVERPQAGTEVLAQIDPERDAILAI